MSNTQNNRNNGLPFLKQCSLAFLPQKFSSRKPQHLIYLFVMIVVVSLTQTELTVNVSKVLLFTTHFTRKMI